MGSNEKIQKNEKILSTGEIAAITTLKTRIQDIIQGNEDFAYDFYLIQWLRVQKFNVGKTETKIREAVKWKAENDIKSLVDEDFDPRLNEALHVDLNGITKEGYPITCANAGNFRVGEAINAFGKPAVYRHWFQVLAKVERNILNARRRLDKESGLTQSYTVIYAKSWLIMNMANLALLEMLSIDVLSVLGTTFRVQVNYFPIISGTICCFNVNKFFDVAFKIVAPILKDSNISIHVFGTNEDKWKPFILECIDEEQIKILLDTK
jgi:hypothetical protein